MQPFEPKPCHASYFHCRDRTLPNKLTLLSKLCCHFQPISEAGNLKSIVSPHSSLVGATRFSHILNATSVLIAIYCQ